MKTTMKQMRFVKIVGGVIASVAVIGAATVAVSYMHHAHMAVLQPRGVVARQERQLMFTAVLLSLVVVLPVFGLLAYVAWRYRASNTRARYVPDWDANNLLESIWWLIPSLLILILSVITWRSSHELDPYRPLASKVSPLTVQVVALDWKWLFIYPAQHIATVNYLELPAGTPINFELTSDAPMNSFWIPQLGGQMYAMPGMSTQLHLEADRPGAYIGSSANISGVGFAGMTFSVHAVASADFSTWVAGARNAAPLTMQKYQALAMPSKANAPATYGSPAPNLYTNIMMKYMMAPQGKDSPTPLATGDGMDAMPMSMPMTGAQP